MEEKYIFEFLSLDYFTKSHSYLVHSFQSEFHN